MKQIEANAGDADAMRRRLQTDLRQAMKRQDAFETAVLRVLIAAIDNAGAVPQPQRPQGPTEIERRHLSPAAVRALLLREHRQRERAAADYARFGRGTESERLRREMEIIRRHLAAPPGRVC
jgi:uncharacterized protein